MKTNEKQWKGKRCIMAHEGTARIYIYIYTYIYMCMCMWQLYSTPVSTWGELPPSLKFTEFNESNEFNELR